MSCFLFKLLIFTELLEKYYSNKKNQQQLWVGGCKRGVREREREGRGGVIYHSS